jgi:hypothetical protein
MAETIVKRKRGRPRKPLELHQIMGTLNVTRHGALLAGDEKPLPQPKLPPEVEAWSGIFRCGYDFFHELAAIGLRGDAKQDRRIRRLAKEARARLGAVYTSAWEPRPDQDKPWAFEQWGEPPKLNNHEVE